MQERELIKLMSKEWPDDSFSIDKDTWNHLDANGKHKSKVTFSIYIVGPGKFFRSDKNWQNAYAKFKLWNEDQD